MKTICSMTKKDRRAFFVCALSLYFPDHTYKVFEGKFTVTFNFLQEAITVLDMIPFFVPNGFVKNFW